MAIRFLTLLLANGRDDFTLHAEVNWHLLLVAAALSAITGVLFGLAPALQSTRAGIVPALKGSRFAAPGRHRRFLALGRMLTVSQIAFSLIILVAAALFVRTLANLEAVQLGFNRENVLTFRVDARRAGHAGPEITSFYGRLRTGLASIPGVRGATLSDLTLVGGRDFTPVSVSGGKGRTSLIMIVGPGFLSTMQVPVHLGREIQEDDMNPSHPGAVVNQAFVKAYLPDRNPLGLNVSFPDDCTACDIPIVGVCGNALVAREVTEQARPTVFLPFTAKAAGHVSGMTYELRTAGNPLSSVPAVRDLVRRADPRLPLSEIRTQSDLIDGTFHQQVVFARLCTGFALLALAIACVGLYGAMSYTVARRTSEIGIRMALGAQRRTVIWTVLREVLLLASAGLAISIPAALAGSKLLKSFLYETRPNDPVSFVIAAISLSAAAALAGYLPARRASRIDPMTALRHE